MGVYLKEGDEYRKVDVRSQFIQVYINSLDVLSRVTAPSALHLLFWAISNMNERNIVKIRKDDKLEFIYEVFKGGGVKYSLSTVNKALRMLSDNNILISHNTNNERSGVYFINPIYFWKGSDQSERKQFIADTIEFIKHKDNEKN